MQTEEFAHAVGLLKRQVAIRKIPRFACLDKKECGWQGRQVVKDGEIELCPRCGGQAIVDNLASLSTFRARRINSPHVQRVEHVQVFPLNVVAICSELRKRGLKDDRVVNDLLMGAANADPGKNCFQQLKDVEYLLSCVQQRCPDLNVPELPLDDENDAPAPGTTFDDSDV